jgi:sigma-E factor negative regulatory protein RseA
VRNGLDEIMMYDKLDDSRAAQLSALVDGELGSVQAAALVQASREDKDLLDTWSSYQAIGDVLRTHARDTRHGSSRNVRGLAPTGVRDGASDFANPSVVQAAPQAAANDSIFRWKLVAGIAALAAVGSIAWSLVATQSAPVGAQLAQRSAPAVTAVAGLVDAASTSPGAVLASSADNAPVMIRDARLDELLAAHKQFGGASALQQPAGFLRNATFQSAGR